MKISIILVALMLQGCVALRSDTDGITNALVGVRAQLESLVKVSYDTQKSAARTLARECAPRKK